jgi:hypothetical protein
MHGNWSFHELHALPVKLRDWFAQRLVKYFEEQVKTQNKK